MNVYKVQRLEDVHLSAVFPVVLRVCGVVLPVVRCFAGWIGEVRVSWWRVLRDGWGCLAVTSRPLVVPVYQGVVGGMLRVVC